MNPPDWQVFHDATPPNRAERRARGKGVRAGVVGVSFLGAALIGAAVIGRGAHSSTAEPAARIPLASPATASTGVAPVPAPTGEAGARVQPRCSWFHLHGRRQQHRRRVTRSAARATPRHRTREPGRPHSNAAAGAAALLTDQ